jgi:MFS family permease
MMTDREEPFDPFNAPYQPIKPVDPYEPRSDPMNSVFARGVLRARATLVGIGAVGFGGMAAWNIVIGPWTLDTFWRIAFFGLAVLMLIGGLFCLRNGWIDVLSSLRARKQRITKNSAKVRRDSIS